MRTVVFNGKTVAYAYDPNGNRTSISYEGGVKESYTYDKNNQLLILTNQAPGGSVISQYSYTYDYVGKQLSKTDGLGTTNYFYDEAGRMQWLGYSLENSSKGAKPSLYLKRVRAMICQTQLRGRENLQFLKG